MQKKGISRKDMEENNKSTIIGNITEKLSFDHMIRGKKFYAAKVAMSRCDGTRDVIPIIVPEDLFNSEIFSGKKYVGKKVEMRGQFRSHNKLGTDGKKHLVLFFFVKEIDFADGEDKNEISLRGYICKQPIYRITPKSKKAITDILIAVNRSTGESDYLPCIAWNKNAVSAGIMHVGDCVKIEGRIQSRMYPKDGKWKVAYEISIHKIKKIEE